MSSGGGSMRICPFGRCCIEKKKAQTRGFPAAAGESTFPRDAKACSSAYAGSRTKEESCLPVILLMHLDTGRQKRLLSESISPLPSPRVENS